MFWLKWALACVVLAVSMGVANAAQAQTSAEVDAIYTYFEPHEVADALAIAECESGLGADILNEYSGAYGMFQFLPSTSYAMGFDHAAMADPYYAAWAASVYQDQAGWTPWSCAAY